MLSDHDMLAGVDGDMCFGWVEKGSEQVPRRRKFTQFFCVPYCAFNLSVVTVGSELRAADDQIGVGVALP